MKVKKEDRKHGSATQPHAMVYLIMYRRSRPPVAFTVLIEGENKWL